MRLILSPRYSDDTLILQQAAWQRGWRTHRMRSWRAEPGELDDVGAIYGETLWTRVVAAQAGRVLIEPQLDWLTRVPSTWLERWVYHGMLSGVPEYPAFVKPHDSKVFEARVYDEPPSRFIDADEMVIASEPLVVEEEWRVWVLNGRAVTAARYRGDDEPLWSAEIAGGFVEVAMAVMPHAYRPPALVVDVAIGAGRHWIVEANPVSGSGVYLGADPQAVLECLAAACVTDAPRYWTQPALIADADELLTLEVPRALAP